jgi:Ran GTPase-activating protein (RanGAP) involved in mRNA processing and transport
MINLADDFKKGLDVYLGMPSFNVKAAMEREHCAAHDSYTKFSPSNNQDMNTWPQMEWDFVVNYDPTKEYPGAGERVGQSLHFFLTHDNAKEACLTETEVIGLRLYSGPMFMHYNMVLRQQTGKQYITTIHAIVSGIIKLSSIMKLPLDRKVYRGLSGVELPEEFWHADKYGAKGGVEMGIMSTTRSMGVAVQYSSYGQVPTVFEIEIGQVDRGAELRWISQFPGEDEVVMPPLSNLEVVGDPYLRCLEGSHTQILIVPLRVNVNIKSKTMEELESTRKDVLLSAIAEMQSEAEQEVSDLAQSMGEITALAAGEAPEWFNDQVAHLEVKDEHSSDSRNKELVLRRRRSDLLELVAARVNKTTAMQKDEGPAVRIRHVTNTIISLERETWYAQVSSRKSSAISKLAQCEEYRRKNALELDVASSLCKDLGKDLLQTDFPEADSTADGSHDFHWGERLMLYTNSVNALDMCVGKGDVIAWREGDCRPAILAANRCRAIFCEHAFDQHALQVRVTVEVQGESCLAVGVFSEEVFKKWQNGDWSLNLPESQSNAAPIMQVDGGVVIAIRTPAAGGDGGKREERGERERERRKKGRGGKGGKEREKEGEKRGRKGGEGKGERGEEGCPSKEASLAMNEIVKWLISTGKDADYAYQALDVDKDGKISLADLQEAAKIHFALSNCNMAALLLELAGSKDSFISRDVWKNLIEASRMGSIDGRAQKFAQLDTRTSLNVEFDCVRNRIFFSTGLTERHDAALDFHDCRAKFYVAAVFLGGESLCKVQIASAPVLTFRDSHMEKPEADTFVEKFRKCLEESTDQTDAKLNHTCPKAALQHLLTDVGAAPNDVGAAPNAPKCQTAQHVMVISTGTYNSFICNRCHVGKSGERWFCGNCKDDCCFECEPRPVNEPGNIGILKGDDISDPAGQQPVTRENFSFVVGGKFYDELVKKVGEGRARTEFILMLATWRTKGYSNLEVLKERAQTRADMIADCRSSLKSVYGAYVDDNAKASRKLGYKQEQAILTSQEATLKFFKDSTHRRVSGVHSLLNHVACERDEKDFGKLRLLPKSLPGKAEITHRMREAFQGLLCIEIAMSKSISQLLLKVVASIFEKVDGKWREAAVYFGPEMEVLEQIDVLVKRILSSLHALQQTVDTFEQLTLDVRSFIFMREETPPFEMDLSKAYELGGVEAKRMQANDRSKSAKECFTMLKKIHENGLASASDNMHSRDLIWMCDESMREETWMYDAKLYDADHADTCLVWLERQCVSSELMRMVERLDDDTLQQAHCQRRFVAMLNAFEAACKVLPLTGSESSGIATKSRFESVKRKLDHVLKGAGQDVHARLEAGKARIQRRWHIELSVNEQSKHDGSQTKDTKSKDDKIAPRVDAHDTATDGDKTSSWEFKRAESRYWQALVLLYLQESTKLQSDRLKRDLPGVKRRSVMRCLELLDDSVYHVSAMEGEASFLPRPDAGAVAELNLDDAADEWEARLLGMLSLRHGSCKWSLDNGMPGRSRELHLNDIACGERKELSLCEPESKTAAFVASFVAHSSPTSVRIFIRDKEGKPSSMGERPIVLVSGGGLTAHISTSESGLKMLDFSGAGLTLHGLRLLVESARTDGDIIEATIADENELDLSEETQQLYANDRFARKSVFEDMRFQTNNFGQEHSEESIAIICNIVAVSAQQLRNLNLSKNRLTSAGARVLAGFLKRGGALALNRLDLSENDLGDDGVGHLSIALQSKHQHIGFLDLARTGFCWKGALHLAEAIQSEACLVTNLVLTGNLVGDAGLVALSASLAGNQTKTMKSLTLADNHIGDIGVEALTYNWTGDEKGSLYSLTALDLSENDITLLGSQKLFVSLEKCAPTLSVLYLSSNRIVHKGIERVAQLLLSCPECLQSLCLETQRPPHELTVSKLNQHQLLVKTDMLSSDLCITEQEAKVLALAELRSSKILKNHLSEMVSDYCGPAKDHAQTQALIAKHLQQLGQVAEKDWKRDTSARSAAMQLLKEQWRKAGKPLSHLNRHDLSLQRDKALTNLVQCSGDMRSREAKHYLSDLSYTKALTTSLEAKQKCIEDFRQNLFSSLMQPLRAMPGAEHQDDKDKVTAATEAATRILEQEVKCTSLHRLVEFQRLLGQKQGHQDAINRARVANYSASVTHSFVREVIEADTVFNAKWSSKIPEEHRAGLSLRVLEEVVQQTLCGLLSALDSAAMQLLKEKDDQRKKEAFEQEEKADTGHAFGKAIEQIEGFSNTKEVPDKQQSLRLVIADEGNRKLVHDLCYSHYDLKCVEQEVQGNSAGQEAAVIAAADPAATDKVKSIPELVITWGDAAQKVPGRRLSTEEEVMSLFEQNAGLKGTWAEHPELTELWDVRSGEGAYSDTFPMGSPDYWREVGWLVTCVHEVAGPLHNAQGCVAQERALVWTNLQNRWGPDLKDFSVAPVEDWRDRTTQKVIELHDQMKQKVADLYQDVHCDLIERAHSLCSGLDDMWDRDPPNPYRLVRDGFENKIGGDRGRLAKFLETHRMLTMVLGVMSASGLKWANTGATQPAEGRILENSKLAEALARKTEFTAQEWESFGIKYLSEDAYIQSGGSYLKPQVGAASDDSVKKQQLEAIVKEMRDVCSEQLRVLTADYLVQKTEAILRQPVRLAQTRIEAVRQHIAGLFKAETASGGEAKAGRFASATLEGLLAATAQHARDLDRLASIVRMLPLDLHLSYPPFLALTISEHPHVLNHTKVLHDSCCNLCSETIQSDGYHYHCSEGCSFDVCMKCAKPLIGDVKEVASAELSLPVALAASAPVLNKKVFFKRKAIEINPPESVPPGLRWKEVGMEKPKTGAEIENSELAAALEQKSEFGQREFDTFKVDKFSCDCYIKVDDKYFTPAATRSYSSVKNDDPAGEGNARSRLGSPHAWFPARNVDGAWMQMDLGEVKRVAGVVTQGAAEGSIVDHQYVREIAVEYRAQEDQAWLTSIPSCFTCKSGDEKVEHVFSAPVEARYIKISVKAWHLGIGMRAGALEEPSQTTSGTIILSDLKKGRCLVSFPARSLRWEVVGAEKPLVGAEVKHESLAAAMEYTVNFSAEEWDKLQVAELTRDSYMAVGGSFMAVGGSYMAVGGKDFRPDDSAYVEEETQWCPAVELVDARATELALLLPAQLARELSQLKHMYREGGAAAKGQQAYSEAIRRVGKLLDDEAKAWDKTCEDRKGKESAAGSKLTQLYSELHSEHACQDWVRCVANSPSGAHMQHFWNLDFPEPEGLLCAMDSDKNETLQHFVNAAGKAIDKRIEVAKVHYQYASGLKWQKCDTQPANGHHLAKSELAGELTRKTAFTQQEWDVFGINDLRMDHFVKSGDCYFKPAETLSGDFPVRIEFVHHRSDDSNEGKQKMSCTWEETEDGVVLSSDNSVAWANNCNYIKALGTGVAAGCTLVFTITEKRGSFMLGLALGGVDLQACGRYPWESVQTILWYSRGQSFIRKMGSDRGDDKQAIPCLKKGDVVRVKYNEASQVSFFVNDDGVPRFTVEDIAGKVRPLFCCLDGENAVSLRFEARETVKKTLVVTCQKKEEGNEESAAARSTHCCAQHPCSRCDAVKHALMDGLVLDFGVALRECAQSVAAAEHQAAIWQVFNKASDTILPAASGENDSNGRVQAALNRLPAALLAEPQCCRRMTAAVSCLAAASCELPVASTALPLRTRFLVPPFEALAESPSLLRCVELLEQGCASKFNEDSTRLRWDREDNPGKQHFHFDRTTNTITYLQGAPDYCNVLSDKPITRGRHTFEFVMHKIGDEQWTGVTADQKLAGTNANLRTKALCWTYYCGRRYASNGRLSEEREETKELEHIKDSDVIGLTVDFTKRTLGFSKNGVFQADCRFPADVKELYLITELDRPDDCVELRCTTPQAHEDRAVTKLSQDRATETLPPQALRDMSTWEARLFASLCVSPYTLAAPSGDLPLQQLAGGELRDVTLRAADVASQDAAFLAHFVARCCKYPVRVRIVREDRRDAAQYFTLNPGGGLAGHIRKDTAQAAASAADRVLFLASMDVDMAALHLLMEAALAGLREAAPAKDPTPDLDRMCENFSIRGISKYNEKNYCDAKITFAKGKTPGTCTVLVCYEVHGDGSLGPLPDPDHSSLLLNRTRQELVNASKIEESGVRIKGTLEYEASLSLGSRIDFSFGNSGYSTFGDEWAPKTLNLGGTDKKDDHTASPEKQGKAPNTSAQFTELLETTAQSIQSLAASKTLTEGQETIDDRDAVQAIELNQNPLIGVGKGTAMKLIVQLAHLAAGRHLLRLHLDNNNIEDAGIQILADAFIRDGFAPRLKILWLHKNRITNVGAKALSTALESSLECVTELCIFR